MFLFCIHTYLSPQFQIVISAILSLNCHQVSLTNSGFQLAAPVYPQVKWLKEHGIDADVIVGAKTKDMLLLEEEMKAVSGNYYPCTDDGSYGHAGMVTTMVEELVNEGLFRS